VLVAGATRIPEDVFYIAARCLAEQVSEADIAMGRMYPPLRDIRTVSVGIAAVTAKFLYDQGLATRSPQPKDLLDFCARAQWRPEYRPADLDEKTGVLRQRRLSYDAVDPDAPSA
jgi:malic enzyme